ncbi:hypothetical protein [Paraflavitalea sp. CAU 1676]|uniref:hypothetical protein n=1 Tax=Paraflavitalea sp. CAU 1676 TaxID=3032598 RepID=UPI0023DCC6A4|nr:hypothetical protein [Paraflavitalea sp. CAU 1676]MDF2189775.1 hypothetical protein [Paraflavitalea sp. CAU 1676]
MKWVGGFLYLIVFVLIIEVIKSFVIKQQFISSYFTGTVLICIQLLSIMGYFLLLIVSTVIRLFKGKVSWIGKLAVVMTFFVVLELGCVFGLKHPARIPALFKWSFTYYYDYYSSALPQFEKKAATYNKNLFYTLKPNARFRYYNAEFDNAYSINGKGLRDDEQSLIAPEIVCLGDSYAMGWGVEQDETFAQQLEHLCGRKTLNGGISSYGTAREMLLLKQLDTSAMKCLVIQYCYNDLGENNSYLNNNYLLPISGELYYDTIVAKQELLKTYFPGKYGLLTSQAFIKKTINRIKPVFALPFEREVPFGEAQQHASALLRILQNSPQIDFSKVTVVITLLDSYDHMQSGFIDALEKMIKQSPYKERFAGNLKVLNMASHLSKSDFYELDLHIRPSGHKKVAEQLRQMLYFNHE